MRTRVHILDVSSTGALVAAECELPNGAAANLKTILNDGAFAPEVRIVRSQARPQRDGCELGVRFTSVDDHSRHHLEGFLRKASA